MKAFVTKGRDGEVKEVPTPSVGARDVLVKVKAVAINPTDWKHLYLIRTVDGAIVGCDFSGEVVKVGSDVKNLKIGDAVASLVAGASNLDPNTGSFAEYVRAEAGRTYIFPKGLIMSKENSIPMGEVQTFEGASSIGVSYTTVGLGFFNRYPDFKRNSAPNEYYLVWGGASSVGQIAIQMAKYLGFKVIATASPRNFDLLKNLGAEKVFDYHDKDVADQIKKYTGDSVTNAFDTISEGPTVQLVSDSLSASKPSVVQLTLPYDVSTLKNPKTDVKFEHPLAYFAVVPKKQFGVDDPVIEVTKQQFDDALKIFKRFNEIIAHEPQVLRHMPIRVLAGGFNDLVEGLQIVKNGKHSGEKIVIRF